MSTATTAPATEAAEEQYRASIWSRIKVGRLVANIALLLIVALWTFPTAGLLISSVRDADQLALSGWWTSLTTSQTTGAAALGRAEEQVEENGQYVISGDILDESSGLTVSAVGITSREPGAFEVGQPVEMRDGGQMVVEPDGAYRWTSATPFEHERGPRVYYRASEPPRFTLDNYWSVLTANGIGQSFLNSLTVAIPATVVPILIAAFAAYALAWMSFPGRGVLVAIIVGLLVVPLQMSLIPILRFYNGVADVFGGEAKGYLGVWLAHTAFGLPLAIFLLRNYMVGLPREIMESARMDGASHFQIFTTMVLPLSFPALASFAIFQFLWVWNDLLVALIFLGSQNTELVLTGRLINLLGSRGNNWELLTAGAFISMIVPLVVFFSLQRYFVRGLLAGSVKGG
ncbi:carbohydrate ABC transporter permease [Pelagibacterium sp. 26DY04]|uniref:carbohydrate ABC transporter permease n=1 Tax=Pelagibacterium sp. 26DY04 TaxID=2967130 RepID=UPI0028166929|nr:carbohydrate ABC transporter permease [Pelagibacterium sp. 26DY04]WMT87785.1 carbohydrate ABC transporter permease [Pelagibacterium sp. 26DY04]